MHLAVYISTNYYENLLGTENTFIYADRLREMMNLPKEIIENMARKLPEELNKISRIRIFELL